MENRDAATPAEHPWTTAAELAGRLRITPTTLRRHLRNPATESWLPRPQQIAGRYVWPTSALVGIEDRKRQKPGNPNWVKATPPPKSA